MPEQGLPGRYAACRYHLYRAPAHLVGTRYRRRLYRNLALCAAKHPVPKPFTIDGTVQAGWALGVVLGQQRGSNSKRGGATGGASRPGQHFDHRQHLADEILQGVARLLDRGPPFGDCTRLAVEPSIAMLLALNRPVELSYLWARCSRSQRVAHRRECPILDLRVSGTRDHNDDGDDDNPVARNTTSRTSRCPTPYPICSPLQHRLFDDFFARVMQEAREHLAAQARRRLLNKRTFTIPETAELTGLSCPEVWQLIKDQEIEANEVSRGYWLLPREVVEQLAYSNARDRNCQAGIDFLAAIIEEETEDE